MKRSRPTLREHGIGLEMEVVAAGVHLGTNLKNDHHHTNVPGISAQGSREIQKHIRTSTATNVQQAKSVSACIEKVENLINC